MAKDGTARGGQRPGSGRKSKALTEKLATGNPGGRKLKVMEIRECVNFPVGQQDCCTSLWCGLVFPFEQVFCCSFSI